MKKILYLLIGISLCSCQIFEKKRQIGTIAELSGHYLYESDLEPILAGLSGEDSLHARELYIYQWATDILVYEKAKDVANNRLESLVEDYRRALYVHDYEHWLVEQQMPKHLPDTLIRQFYNEHPQRFILRESIVKGLLLIVPNGAPALSKVMRWMQTPEKNIENLEKYVYQYAVGYEFFLDQWQNANTILVAMPFEKNDLERQLVQTSQLMLKDSLNTYLLQVTDKRLKGQQAPIDYARFEIEKIILNQRQVDFLQKNREQLYENAILLKKIKFYDQE